MRSWIQDHALGVLLRSEQVGIKDMRPAEVPANLFSYHLEGLIRDKIVEKSGRGKYQLTPKGKKFAGQFSTSTYHQAENLKTVIVLYSQDTDGKPLLFRWSRQPYIDKVTLVWDRMHFGRSIDESLKVATMDKLGIHIPAEYLTSLILRVEHEGELVSHMNTLVYQIDSSQLKLPKIVRNGEAFYADPSNEADSMGGLEELINYIASKKYSTLREFTLTY